MLLTLALLIFAVVFAVVVAPAPAAERFAGITESGRLVGFTSQNPYALTKPLSVRGLAPGERVVALGQAARGVVAVGTSARLYALDLASRARDRNRPLLPPGAARVALLAGRRAIATCRDCRHFRAGLRDTRRGAAILMPAPLMVVAFGLLTGKAAAATAKGAMVKSAATAAAGVALTAGAVGVGVQVFHAGEPAPQGAHSRALPSGRLAKGGAVPAGTAIVRRTEKLASGTATVTLPCPPGLRVADLIGARGASASYAPGTVVGVSRSARVIVSDAACHGWRKITTDTGEKGWVRAAVIG
jgi:hypothetical protein